MRLTWIWAVLLVASASAGYAQLPEGQVTVDGTDLRVDFRVEVVAYLSADFNSRVSQYADLRRTLEEGLPPLQVTSDPADIWRAEVALAKKIRKARGPNQGELFTPAITQEFRRVLMLETTADAVKSIMGENPGSFSHRINGTYPKERPLSTVPANILALLPPLPKDIQYRFLGRTLVLHDTRANVILDRITCALDCS
jgi:hypothetical protein